MFPLRLMSPVRPSPADNAYERLVNFLRNSEPFRSFQVGLDERRILKIRRIISHQPRDPNQSVIDGYDLPQ